MKKMNLNDTWENCLAMWKWIAKNANKASVFMLKARWLHRHGFNANSIFNNCFFCEYAKHHRGGAGYENMKHGCRNCPGIKVDRSFDCAHKDYNFQRKPAAFYKKIVELNKKRRKG